MTPTEIFEQKFRKPRAGRTLIVGSHVYATREDRRKLYKDVVGADMLEGPGVDWVCDLEEPLPLDVYGRFDHIECRSVLEHSRRPWLLAQNLELLMNPGATLDLAAPFVWRPHSYPDDYFRYTISGVRELFPGIEWRALMYVTQAIMSKGEGKMPKHVVDGVVYLPRTEVLGFGEKR